MTMFPNQPWLNGNAQAIPGTAAFTVTTTSNPFPLYIPVTSDWTLSGTYTVPADTFPPQPLTVQSGNVFSGVSVDWEEYEEWRREKQRRLEAVPEPVEAGDREISFKD